MIILPVKRFKLFYIFAEFQDFVTDVDKRDIEMDFVAQEMKQIGAYVARQLSFKGATFRIQKVTLSPEFKKIYDDSVELWVKTRQLFTEATEIVNAHSSKSQSKWSLAMSSELFPTTFCRCQSGGSCQSCHRCH